METELPSQSGFILTRSWRDSASGVLLDLWLSTETGPVQLSINSGEAVCFVLRRDAQRAVEFLQSVGMDSVRTDELTLKNFKGLAVNGLYFVRHKDLTQSVQKLRDQGFKIWEADIRPPERYLMERYITGALSFSGGRDLGSNSSDGALYNPEISASEYRPKLSLMSVDIETSMDGRKLYSIGCYSRDAQGNTEGLVYMIGPAPQASSEPAQTAQSDSGLCIIYVDNERQCLSQFLNYLADTDPDVLIGWNVIQFDLWLLEQFCQKHQLTFALGRNRQSPHWRQESDTERRFITIPGRVALDGIDLLKTAFYNFQSFSLNNVAAELLGDGKLLHSSDRGEEITRLFHQDKIALAQYNLKDCELVWRIFEKTHLLEFAIERSQLTGMKLDRMGGSAASFEYAYLPQLHRAGYVAPNLHELKSDVISPGGFVMDSQPGLYKNILVLDFKSLYPSIIRTFNIDPCAFWRAQHGKLNGSQVVPGFNGASFDRKGALLPDIIKNLWTERDKAKAEKNAPLSQAIKIIMNSFYGVLGSPGCRFFDPRISSSITLRGHEILQTTKAWIEERGFEVIYGDTDSVFVHVDETLAPEKARAIGDDLAQTLNQRWQEDLRERFNIESFLELEFETHYSQFLMPTIRGSDEGSKKRYAGLIQHSDREEPELIFKGLESVRTDWTELAKEFQRELYRKVFLGDPVEDYIRNFVEQLKNGERDHQLIYRKRLRQQLHEYQRNIPPQVQAAKKMVLAGGKVRKGDWIEYVMTMSGPEPADHIVSQIDYQRYQDKQLQPVADSILRFLDNEFSRIVDKQMGLF